MRIQNILFQSKPKMKAFISIIVHVIAEIENSIICEVHGKGIKSSWISNPEKRTCDACDFRTFCAKSESTKNVLTVP